MRKNISSQERTFSKIFKEYLQSSKKYYINSKFAKHPVVNKERNWSL